MQNMFSLESLIEEVNKPSIASDYGNDHGMYGMEAFDALNESEILSTRIEGFESGITFANTIVNNIASERGFESIDIYSMEGIGDKLKKAGEATKKTMIKVWNKLVEAISNFIKQIHVFISGPQMKSQKSFYEKNKKSLSENWGEGSKRKLSLLPAPKNGLKPLATMVQTIGELVSDTDKLVDKAEAGKDIVSKKFLAVFTAQNYADADPKKVVYRNFYGKGGSETEVKRTEQTISSVYSLTDFENLAKTDFVTGVMKTSQSSLKTAQKALKKAQAGARKEDGRGADSTKNLAEARKIISKCTSTNLNAFSVYMKYRSDLVKAMRAVIKGKGKSDDDS